jgi:hypothetical protein
MALYVIRTGENPINVNALPKVRRSPRTEEEIETIIGVCKTCDFFVDDVCQHLDCKFCPGKQRTAGGFKVKLTRRSFICPAKKWE